jgi:single-strand DNA-binding protein
VWNEVLLVGRITHDLEVKKTSSGLSLLNFQLANQPMPDKTYFIKCLAFDKVADNLVLYVSKGDKVAIKGKLQTSEYTNKDGKKVSSMEVVIVNFQLFGKREDKEQSQPGPKTNPTPKPKPTENDFPGVVSDDLPF